MIRDLLLQLALLCLALLLGATAYESVVMAPNYERDIPESLDIARQFMRRVTPANYFRVLAPLTLVILLAGIAVSWQLEVVRWWMVGGFVAVATGDVITFAFHYPRLNIMFKAPLTDDADRLRKAAGEWAAGNFVRLALLAIAFLCVLQALGAVIASVRP
jgi:hypothetical protein